MVSGLPDYFTSVRPRYGSAQKCWGSKILTPNVENTFCDITGKGMIYGGNMSLDFTLTQKWSVINLYVDGAKFYAVNFDTLYKYRHIQENAYPIYLIKRDETNFIYSIGVSVGYTFESGFKFSYTEGHGAAEKVYYNLFYALIT